MRGTLAIISHYDGDMGIIPAYAGDTKYQLRAEPDRWDHPRVCGEHGLMSGLFDASQGSSPRMRGTPGRRLGEARHGRIIPAYAGNTACTGRACVAGRDHPRVCGEHKDDSSQWRSNRGSSPRMRGTPNSQSKIGKIKGIIPAYAGNTRTCLQAPPRGGDHPRVCGEHTALP